MLLQLLKTSSFYIQQSIVSLIAFLIILLNLFRLTSLGRYINSWGKWSILLIANIIVQLLILSTGAFQSPFLVLIHLSTLGISLIFRFSIAVIFLCFSVINILLITTVNQNLNQLWVNDLGTVLLLSSTFVAIVPLAKLLSDTYHLKDILLKTLSNQIKVEESLLAEINELIFITDNKMRILSLNDAVERTLRKSRSELMFKSIFDILFLKDEKGNIVTKENLYVDEILKKKLPKFIPNLSLIATAETMRKVNIQIQPIADLEGSIDQVSFIITDSKHGQTVIESEHKNIDEARIKHEAMIEDLKRRLLKQGLFDLAARFIFISKAEQDILGIRTIEDHGITQKKVLVDVASICSQVVLEQQDFARVLRVPLAFNLPNFESQDYQTLVIKKTLNILPNQSTGPFFTVLCDVTFVELLVKKLLEVAILLTSGQHNSKVDVNVNRSTSKVSIEINANYPHMEAEEVGDVFKPYYGRIRDKSNLHLGSGLEGSLAKTIADSLSVQLRTDIESNSSFSFVIVLERHISAISLPITKGVRT